MFKIISLSLILATPAVAQDELASCESMGEFAGTIMSLRQNGMRMSELLDALVTGEPGAEVIETIIYEAFDRPFMSMQKNKAEMEARFRETWEVGCFNARRGS